ncbi:DUF192 domain-containing protein [Halovenus marina]|uniref:DUF192 domain-containing protein n=1 Tax=Halovenus marina TaxID=3396621 RepID=UPI003F568E50
MAELRIVHEQDDTIGDSTPNREILARNVDVAESSLSQAKGLMGRSSLPDDYALVLEVGGGDSWLPFTGGPSRQIVHMLFVRVPIDVIWLADDEVTKTARMHPWRSIAVGKADRILELPAGAAENVSRGDRVRLDDADETDE